MAITLQKGERVNLSKSAPNLTNVNVGLGWDPVDKSNTVQEKKGLFGKIMKTAEKVTKPEIDIDASAFLLNASGKCINIVYFNNLSG